MIQQFSSFPKHIPIYVHKIQVKKNWSLAIVDKMNKNGKIVNLIK